MTFSIDGFATGNAPESTPWKPQVGDTLDGVVEYVATTPFVRWDELRKKTTATLKIVVGDVAIYPRTHLSDDRNATTTDQMSPAPDRLMRAIAQAVIEAGARSIDAGATLKIRRVEDADVLVSGITHKAHDYKAKYTPAARTASVNVDDLL